MTALIDLSAVREARIEAAWSAYVAALNQANQTLAVQDGIAAGKAWRRWLDLFMTADQREWLDQPAPVARPTWGTNGDEPPPAA